MTIQVGDQLPSLPLQEGTPKNTHDARELFQGKTGILIAVPGAFTPGCSLTHLPSYVDNIDQLREQGYDLVACVSVNDAFVMEAWGKAQGAEGKILMLADPDAAFTKALGLEVNAGALGGIRSKRYSMVIKDGVITQLNVEPDGFGITCSLAGELL
jgi:2-Cys peroxiredoxin 5